MGDILQQLGLDKTFFYLFFIFLVFFLILSNVYFKPFLKLFQMRHKHTVQDREAAEKMLAQADAKFADYQKRLHDERLEARADYERLLAEAKKQEAEILADARNEAKKITQETLESMQTQRDQVRKQLEGDVENIANAISDSLLVR